MCVTDLFAIWRTLSPEEREVGQRVGELLIRHPCVRKHACARVSFPDCMRALLVSLEMQRLRASQIDRWRIELSDERGGVGCELRLLLHVPIHAMAVVTHALPVKDCSAPLGIAYRLCALG